MLRIIMVIMAITLLHLLTKGARLDGVRTLATHYPTQEQEQDRREMEHDHISSMRFDTDDGFHKVPLAALPGYSVCLAREY